MNIKIKSGKHTIVSSGDVFLFDKSDAFTVTVLNDNEYLTSVVIKFIEDESGKRNISSNIDSSSIVILCSNFEAQGAGLVKPVQIATIGGKSLHLIFWSYLEGSQDPRVRRVKYTIYYDD